MSVHLALRSTDYDDAALARLAEHIECRAWMDIVSAAPAWLREATGVLVEEFGGAVMIAARRVRHLLFNRVIGLGEGLPARGEHIEAVMDRYWELGVKKYWVHSGPHARPARLGRLLQEHGLELYRRSWVKMIRPAREPRGSKAIWSFALRSPAMPRSSPASSARPWIFRRAERSCWPS